MPIPIQVRGYSIAHRSKARPAAVAESGDGGSWAEQAFQHRHWRAWSTRRAISLPPAMASSRRSIAISEILRTSAISLLIIAARSPVFRAGRVGISACKRNKIMRKLAKLTSILLVSVFIGMQFVPTPAISKTPTAETHTAEMINPQVGKILDRSCQDCHSNRTVWPWYSHVAPVSWVISRHVIEGREVLDFSNWATQPPSDGERMLVCAAVSDGAMPLRDYAAIH